MIYSLKHLLYPCNILKISIWSGNIETTKSLSGIRGLSKLREITRGHNFEIYEKRRQDFTFIESK
jgi:hypothetical protein